MLSDKTLDQHLDRLDYYDLLGVPRDAAAERVRDAFHSFALRYHPDRHVGDDVEQKRALRIFKRGSEAYRVLLDPGLRARYDASLGKGEVRLRPQDERRTATAAAPAAPAGVVKNVAPAAGDPAMEAPMPPDVRPLYDQAAAALQRGDVRNAKAFLMIVAKKSAHPKVKALTREVLEAERNAPKR